MINAHAAPQKIAELEQGEAREQVAELLGTNRQYVSDAKQLKESDPELFNKVREGQITLSEAKKRINQKEKEMKYSQELTEEICGHIANGLTDKDACTLSDISQDTLITWKKEKLEFSEAIKKAEAEFKKTLIGNIQRDRSWQSSAWLLERKYRDEFGAINTKEIHDRLDQLEEAARKKHE